MKAYIIMMEGVEWSVPIKGYASKEKANRKAEELNAVPKDKRKGHWLAPMSHYEVQPLEIDTE